MLDQKGLRVDLMLGQSALGAIRPELRGLLKGQCGRDDFTPARWIPRISGRPALCGTESSTRRDDYPAGSASLVQCRRSLRHSGTRCHSGNELLATTLEPRRLAAVSRGTKRCERPRCDSSKHAHRQTARHTGIRKGAGKSNAAQTRAEEGAAERNPEKIVIRASSNSDRTQTPEVCR